MTENSGEVKLYTASGTGNTYRLGCWLKEQALEKNRTGEVVMIEQADVGRDLSGDKALLVGFLFPVHGFMPPWSMIKFLFGLPRAKGQQAFCAATRGALKIGPLQIPGVAALACFFTAALLWFKGFSVRGIFSLDMPSNFINFHWGFHKNTIDAISLKARKRAASFFEPVLEGKTVFLTLNNAWEAFWGAVILWFVPVFPVLYLIVGKLFMAKLMFSNHKCNGCGICAAFCPNKGIVMKKVKKEKRPFWTYHCETCLRCMGYCPKKAVEASHSWGVILFFTASIPVFVSFTVWFAQLFHSGMIIESYWLRQMVSIIYVAPALLISYRLFWYLNRVGLINRFFTWTTLTHYYRRYHEPGTRLKELNPRKKKKE